MPRITAERRAANRAAIVAAARRCFSRDGFHRTSMPDIATEAGVSTGAPYRYFSGKEEIIVEVARDAFAVIFDPVIRLIESSDSVGIGELVSAAVSPLSGRVTVDTAGDTAPVDDLLRCAVQAWAELLRNPDLHEHAADGFERNRRRISEALRRGRNAGVISHHVDPDRGARVVMAVLHGFVLQRVAFGLTDVNGFTDDVRAIVTGTNVVTTDGNTG